MQLLDYSRRWRLTLEVASCFLWKSTENKKRPILYAIEIEIEGYMSLGIYLIQQRLVYFVVFLDSPQSRLTPFYPCSLVQKQQPL